MTKDIKKYKNAVLYLANKLGGKIRGKKKLAKLLYFVDFDFFEKYEKSITGATYKHLPMGPYPVELAEIISLLEEEKLIVTSSEENCHGYSPTEIFEAKAEVEAGVFENEEIKMLDRVVSKYGELNGGQLEQLSHSEAPYLGTELNEEIPYELSFYRDTDFTEQNA